MIITISGLHGTGKSSVGRILAEKLGLKFYSTGIAFRELAKEMDMNLGEFTKFVELNNEIDEKLDNKVIKIAKDGNVLIDSQLGGFLLDKIADFKIFLFCPLEIRVKRMSERDNSDFEEKLKETQNREISELERFKLLHNIDLSDMKKIKKVHNIFINTEDYSLEEVVNQILLEIKEKQ